MTASPSRFARACPGLFSALVLLLLSSFLAGPKTTLPDLSESFGLHDQLVRGFGAMRLWSGDRVYKQALIGKQGWIYFTGDASLQDYQRTRHLSHKELEAFRSALVAFQSSLAGEGRTFLFVIAPDKGTIYPQFMPDEIPILGKRSILDQVLDYARDRGTTSILDLRPALRRASATEWVYSKYDTHWTELGAYYAYREIVWALTADHPELKARPLEDFERRTSIVLGPADLLRTMGIPPMRAQAVVLVPRFPADEAIYLETLPNGVNVYHTPSARKDLPSVLLIGDSFYSIGLQQFIENGFGGVTAVQYITIPEDGLNQLVRLARSDIVIVEVAERRLEQLMPLFENARP